MPTTLLRKRILKYLREEVRPPLSQEMVNFSQGAVTSEDLDNLIASMHQLSQRALAMAKRAESMKDEL